MLPLQLGPWLLERKFEFLDPEMLGYTPFGYSSFFLFDVIDGLVHTFPSRLGPFFLMATNTDAPAASPFTFLHQCRR